jgi:lipid II:glycine glycyltransferase (peptidoglycan interpeptide bridge formation enzyme)
MTSLLLARELPALEPGSSLGAAWEALVADAPESGFMQGLGWAEFKRAQGLDVVHVGVFRGEELVGGALAYASPLAGGLLVSPDGPVLPWADEALTAVAMRVLHEAFADVAARRGAIAWRIEPRLKPPSPKPLRSFKRAPVDLLPSETLYLDLTPGPEAVLAAMHPKGRYNIRLAARKDVVVDRLPPGEGLDLLYEALQFASMRHGFFLEPRGFFATLLDTHQPVVHVAHFDDRYLAAHLMVQQGKRATYLYGGVTGAERNRMAGYALQWAAIQQACAAGCESYDFYGFDPFGRPDHLYASFSRFKRQFGGQAVQTIGAQEHFFLDRLADAVVRAVQEIGW